MFDMVTITPSTLTSVVFSTASFDAVASAESSLASIIAQPPALSGITIIK